MDELLSRRLASQLLASREPRTPHEIVTWFGAMQAQDLESALWSIGRRGQGLTRAAVTQAIEERSILRTWPMRGTIHFVPAEDARWMLELSGVRALAGAARRRGQLGLDDSTVHRAVDVLGAALSGGVPLSRPACLAALESAGIATAGQRGYHLLWYAAQIGVTCIGPQDGKQQTFALLDEWAPQQRRLARDEALVELCIRFFRSHGPADRHDFSRWTGLPLGDTDRAIAAAGAQLVRRPGDRADQVMSPAVAEQPPVTRRGTLADVLLLPGFDEYVLGYRDRSQMIPVSHLGAIVPGNNGIFLPTIVDRGRVIGTWRRTTRRNEIQIDIAAFDELSARQSTGIDRAAHEHAAYFGVRGSSVRDGSGRSGATGS